MEGQNSGQRQWEETGRGEWGEEFVLSKGIKVGELEGG